MKGFYLPAQSVFLSSWSTDLKIRTTLCYYKCLFYTLSIKFSFKEHTSIHVLCFGGGSFWSPYGIQILLVRFMCQGGDLIINPKC